MQKHLAVFRGFIVAIFFAATFFLSSSVFASADTFIDLPPRPFENTNNSTETTSPEKPNNNSSATTDKTENPENPKGVVQTFPRESNIKQWDIKVTLLSLLAGGVVLFLILFMLARQKKL